MPRIWTPDETVQDDIDVQVSDKSVQYICVQNLHKMEFGSPVAQNFNSLCCLSRLSFFLDEPASTSNPQGRVHEEIDLEALD